VIAFLSHFTGLLILLVLAVISFLLSLSETSVISTSKIKLRHLVAQGVRNAREVEQLLTRSDKMIVGILVGNNFVNIAFSAIVTGICVARFGRWGVFIATVSSTFFILTFCDILPKVIAIKSPERMALFVAPGLQLYLRFAGPLTRFFTRISDMFLGVLGIEHSKRSPLITEEELRLMIEVGKEEGVLTDEERGLLHRIFEFGDTRISDVMVPKEKIVAVSIDSTPEQVLDTFVEKGHARIPVYKGSVDHIVGIIYARDLLYSIRDKGLFVLADLVHAARFISPDMQVIDVLRQFQTERIQIAVAAGKNGATLGLVTLEDLTEEIVGEVKEQYSREK
jgi:putative hemolysin